MTSILLLLSTYYDMTACGVADSTIVEEDADIDLK